MSEWTILQGIIIHYLVRILEWVVPLIGGIVIGFLVKRKEGLLRGFIWGLVCYTCLLAISYIWISAYNEYSKIPVSKVYEEILVPAETVIGLNEATLKDLISMYGNNLSGSVYVKDNTIAYRLDGGTPTTTTAQQLTPGDQLPLQSVSALKNFRAIAINGKPVTIAVNYYKGRLK